MIAIKNIIWCIPLVALSGCLATGGQGFDTSYNGANDLERALRQFENERPGLKKLCVALDAGYKPAKGEFSISRKAYGFEDTQVRWDHLVRLGVFSKQTDKTSVTYRLTSVGQSTYNEGTCSSSVESYGGGFSGPALVYATLEFNRLGKTQRNPYHPVASTSFTKHLVAVAPWGADKEFRRAWRLQGMEEIENLKWFVSYKTTSNGIEFTEHPQLFVLQN